MALSMTPAPETAPDARLAAPAAAPARLADLDRVAFCPELDAAPLLDLHCQDVAATNLHGAGVGLWLEAQFHNKCNRLPLKSTKTNRKCQGKHRFQGYLVAFF